MSAGEQRKLAAIMFTDMVGYSALSQRDDKLALELLEEHRQLLREIFPRFNGTEIKTIGDAFLIEFHSALEAAQCAIEIQRTLAKRNHDVTSERRIELKIGIHIGDVVHREGDVYGDGVNIASRIEPLAGAGGICVSMDVERQIRNALEARFEKLAPTELKNISVAMDLFRIVLPWQRAAVVASPVSKKRAPMTNIAMAALIILALLAVAGLWWLTHDHSKLPATLKSIAVMPFENASANAETEYLSDGMTETLISSLSQLPELNVKARASVFRYKGKGVDTSQIARELNVQAILNGRVVQHGSELSLYIELVDAALDKVMWSQQYNRKQADLVTLQSEIARDVSSRLKTKLSEADKARVTKVHTTNPEAYQLYLKGNYYTSKFTRDGFRKGIDFFNQAIAVDPNYALAYAGLAFNYITYEDWFIPPNEAVPKAKDAVRKALALDDTLADAHLALAMSAHWYDWDWATAEPEYKRAIELNPNDPRPHAYYSWFLAPMGRYDEALAEAKRCQQLDPVSPETNAFLGSVLVFSRQYDQAIEQLRSGLELDQTYWYAHYFLGWAYEQKGKLPEAIAEFQRALELEKDNAENWANLGHAYGLSGKKAEALKIIEHLKELSASNYIAPYNVAAIHTGLGDKDQAFAWLDRAYGERSSMLALYLTNDPRMDSLRSDPRFTELIRRVGLPH
jgi:adenylate cyclase